MASAEARVWRQQDVDEWQIAVFRFNRSGNVEYLTAGGGGAVIVKTTDEHGQLEPFMVAWPAPSRAK